MKLLRNAWLWIGLFLFVLAAAGGWWYLNRGPQIDALMRAAFENAETVVAYAQSVETETLVEDRRILVEGDYRIDEENKRFSSQATTVLTLPDGTEYSFSMHTITVADDMYTKVESKSAELNLTVPSSPDWKHFRIDAIPPEYREIATPRPPLDNMSLFRSGGKFLSVKEGRRDEVVDGETLARYTFNLSSHAFTEKTGAVSMIAERVGVYGIIDVWVHEPAAQIRQVRFVNEPYISTTVFSQINNLAEITSPTR